MNEDLKTLLELLRSTGLDWLATEVQDAIDEQRESFLAGRFEEAEERLFSGPLDWTDNDSLRVAIGVVHSHLVQPIKLWDDAVATIRTEAEGRLVLVDENQTLQEPFTVDVRQNAQMFERALAEIWPGGPKEFHNRFKEGNS
jgi:hypothetical protein